MPNKRKRTSETSSPYTKRARSSDDDPRQMTAPTKSYERPRNDPTYGQKSAFPGLDDVVGDELFYGPAEDGMEYLRMVR